MGLQKSLIPGGVFPPGASDPAGDSMLSDSIHPFIAHRNNRAPPPSPIIFRYGLLSFQQESKDKRQVVTLHVNAQGDR
jgi:hypothetical protein